MLPLTETIFTWRAVVAALIIFTVAVIMAWLLAPQAREHRGATSASTSARSGATARMNRGADPTG